MTRQHRSEDVLGKEKKKKKSSPENNASQKARCNKNSTIQVGGEDDMNVVFNVTMSETMSLRKLEDKPPRIVLVNNTITKCNGCGRNFKAEDQKEPNNMVFKINTWYTRRDDRGEKVPNLPIAVPGIWHVYGCRGRGYYQKIYTAPHFMSSVLP